MSTILFFVAEFILGMIIWGLIGWAFGDQDPYRILYPPLMLFSDWIVLTKSSFLLAMTPALFNLAIFIMVLTALLGFLSGYYFNKIVQELRAEDGVVL